MRIGTTINGVVGKLKVACRNSVNTTLTDGEWFKSATAANATDIFTSTAHGFVLNDMIRINATTIPTGLTNFTKTYYVRTVTANTFQVSATLGGAAALFTTDGAGAANANWLSLAQMSGVIMWSSTTLHLFQKLGSRQSRAIPVKGGYF